MAVADVEHPVLVRFDLGVARHGREPYRTS